MADEKLNMGQSTEQPNQQLVGNTPVNEVQPPRPLSQNTPKVVPVQAVVNSQPKNASPEVIEENSPVIPVQQEVSEPSPLKKEDVSAADKLFGAIGYWPIFCFLPLALSPNSPVVQFHAKQGLLLMVAWFIVLVALMLEPISGTILFLALLIVSSIGSFQAFMGSTFRIPVLSGFAEKINLDNLFKSKPIDRSATMDHIETPKEQEKSSSVENIVKNEDSPVTPPSTNDVDPQ